MSLSDCNWTQVVLRIVSQASLTFLYQSTDKHNLKNPNKNMALAYLSIYYTWKKH